MFSKAKLKKCAYILSPKFSLNISAVKIANERIKIIMMLFCQLY